MDVANLFFGATQRIVLHPNICISFIEVLPLSKLFFYVRGSATVSLPMAVMKQMFV